MEAETLQLLTRVLKEEEERLLEDVGKLEEEVGEEGMKKRGGAGGGKTEEKVEDEVKTKKVLGENFMFLGKWLLGSYPLVQKWPNTSAIHFTSLV